MKTKYPQLSEWSADSNTVLEYRNSSTINKENNVDSRMTLTNINENYVTIKSGFRWKSFPCCLSSAFYQGLIIGVLTASLILAVVTALGLTSVRQTLTTTTISADISTTMNTNTTSTTRTSATSSTRTTSTTSSTTRTSSSSTTSSTSTTSVTTTTDTTTISNICTGGANYTTQLLYLNLTSNLHWTQYSFNYTAPNVNSATLMFTLRNDPSYWYLDDVSVTNSSGDQLIVNGDFETGSLTGWTYCNPSSVTYSGTVTSSVSYSGWYSYKDGSVGASDYLSQTFAVVPNNIYSVTFWLHATSNNESFALVTITS